MKSVVKKLALGTAVSMMLGICLVGCSSEPAGTPIDQRKPGQDITPEARKDKQGDAVVPQSGK